uniref:Uncharacterized protein n=1 Tax=Nymphaea colorata TaxID=210225 RepID=A0A5K1BQD1_9MAGN
MALNLTREREF